MAVIPIRILARIAARWIAGGAAAEAARRISPTVRNELERILGKPPEEASEAEIERAINRSNLTEEDLEEVIMVDFNSYMSVGLRQCGSDERTFAQLVQLWNREKEAIQQMTMAELRQNLTCP